MNGEVPVERTTPKLIDLRSALVRSHHHAQW
jgi:hypothetical protein